MHNLFSLSLSILSPLVANYISKQNIETHADFLNYNKKLRNLKLKPCVAARQLNYCRFGRKMLFIIVQSLKIRTRCKVMLLTVWLAYFATFRIFYSDHSIPVKTCCFVFFFQNTVLINNHQEFLSETIITGSCDYNDYSTYSLRTKILFEIGKSKWRACPCYSTITVSNRKSSKCVWMGIES